MTSRLTANLVSAADIARDRGIDPKRFRAALRAADLAWHRQNEGWTVLRESREHHDLIRVLASLVDGALVTQRKANDTIAKPAVSERPPSRVSDEAWVIDLCDVVLGRKAVRQHRFRFCGVIPGRLVGVQYCPLMPSIRNSDWW